MPKDFPQQWIINGYSHIYSGIVRIALTNHERKGQSIKARLSFLDTRFMKYQHANLGTLDVTLDVGTVLVTLFPNFIITLSNPYFIKVLKIQF